MEQLKWISENWMQVLAAVLAVMVLAEGVIRALEALAKGLLVVAGWTATTKDDEALTGIAAALHSAAEWLAAATAWLRPFSLRGPTPGIHAGKMATLAVLPAPTSATREEDDTNPGGIAKKNTRRDGFIEWRVLVEVGLWGAVVATGILLGALLTGCGASQEEVRETACSATRLACRACEVAEERWCGGAHVDDGEGSGEPKPCGAATSGGELPARGAGDGWVAPPDIDREYHGET